jgi:hypothetical protein
MKVKKLRFDFTDLTRAILQVISFDPKIKEYGQFDNYFEALKELHIPGAKSPEGLSGLVCNFSFDDPKMLVEIHYRANKTNEQAIIEYLKAIGIETKGELDSEALRVLEEYEKKRDSIDDYLEGKNDELPPGISEGMALGLRVERKGFNGRIERIKKIVEEQKKYPPREDPIQNTEDFPKMQEKVRKKVEEIFEEFENKNQNS